MKKTCIICPVGCELEIEKNGDEIVVSGNSCIRGIEYGKSEMIAPKRVVTALIRGKNQICSVKTDKAILRDKIEQLLDFLNNLPQKSYNIGDVAFEQPIGIDCNIVVTGIQNI